VDTDLGTVQGSLNSADGAGKTERARLRSAPRFLLVLPTAVWLALFFIAPLALMAVYSFGTSDFITFTMRFGWTLQNYEAMGKGLYLGAILRSLELSATATAACMVIGLPLAFFTVRQRPAVQRLLLLATIVPFWTSFLIRTYAWVNILQNEGLLQGLLQRLGLVHGSLNIMFSPTAIAIGIVYSYLTLMVLPIYVALERLDPAVMEAASDLGAHGFSLMSRIVIPLATPGLVAGAILVGIPATGEFVIPAILGGGKTLMLGNVIADQFLNVGNLALGAAMAMTLMTVLVVILVLVALAQRTRTKTQEPETEGAA
jgi:ABC-type spermidine/putrescine transport system permease subunit I